MSKTIPQPPAEYLREFLSGTLPPHLDEQVESWVKENPEEFARLAEVPVQDTLLAALSTVPDSAANPAEVERIIRDIGHTIHAEQSLPAGLSRLASYRLVRVLGRGGMGVVCEAVDENCGRRAAVKVPYPDRSLEPHVRRRFLKECRAAAALNSDHVVTIYQVGEEEGVLFLAMEFLEGATLEDWRLTRPGPVTAEEIVWVAKDVLRGLTAAHAAGLIHRDIKPANLWVQRREGETTERVKVVDFGLACLINERTVSVGAGTPEYMSPEQADSDSVTFRSDLFSLGVVLYQLASGISPFRRETRVETLIAVAQAVPEPLTNPPPALSEFIAGLMAKNPKQRPEDAAAALDELRKVEAELAGDVVVHPSKPTGMRWGWRAIAAGFGSAVAVAVLVIVIISRDKNGQLAVVVATGTEKQDIELTQKDGAITVKLKSPEKESDANGELKVGSRVTVVENTYGFLNKFRETSQIVYKGSTGRITAIEVDLDLIEILFDEQQNGKLWVSHKWVR
jgi:tRNA A-37 threonylcarbamoyl transferase component Bud32